MHVLVTGAGLVGCYLARELIERGHSVVLYDVAPVEAYIESVAPGASVVQGDTRDLAGLIDAMQAHQVNTVVHTAFLIGQRLANNPYSGLRTNVDGSLAVLEAARLAGAGRVLFASTFGIYNWDRPPTAPITEDFPVAGDHLYLASKIATERLLTALAVRHGMPFATLRFAQIYGRGHYAGGDLAGPAVHAALAAALAGDVVRLDPGVLTINDYVYVKDIAQGVASACERPLQHNVYNLGSGGLATTEQVAEAIREAVPGARVETMPGPVLGPFWRHEQALELTRSRQELGYRPRFDIANGIADFVQELRRAESSTARAEAMAQ